MSVLLETERLVLRRWTPRDVDALFRIFGDREVMRYVGEPAPSADFIRERWTPRFGQYDDGTFRMFAVEEKASGRAVGNMGFGILEETGETEIAYHFARTAWGKGYATESGTALLRHGYEVMGLDCRILGLTYPENLASRRVLDKLGFTEDGMGRYFGLDLRVQSVLPPGFPPGYPLLCEKTVAVSSARAFRAFTDPGELSTWFTTRAAFEPWVGGKYRNGDGDRGSIWTFLPPARLRFTWENPDHAPGSVVEVRFKEISRARTRILLSHLGLRTPEAVEDLREGWSWALDSVASYLETGEPISHEAWLASRRDGPEAQEST